MALPPFALSAAFDSCLPTKRMTTTTTMFACLAKVSRCFSHIPLPHTSLPALSAAVTLLLFRLSSCFCPCTSTKLVASPRLGCLMGTALVHAHLFFCSSATRLVQPKHQQHPASIYHHPRTACPPHNPSPSPQLNARQLDEQPTKWLEAKENPLAESPPGARLALMEARSSRATPARLVSRLVLHHPQPSFSTL
jgi:hypothetical protein